MADRLPRPRGIPAHERCSLHVPDLHVTDDARGSALRFGPGPAVSVFAESWFDAKRQKLMAAWALLMLDDCLVTRKATP